jgi:hypothetical protein
MARGINMLTQLPSYWYDEWMKGQERIAELEAENKRLSKVIREKHLFAGLGCRRCATVGNEDTDYSGWTFNEGEGWLCPKHTEAELAALNKMLMTLFMEERDSASDRGQVFFMPSDIWLADLRAHAEEGGE